MLGELLVVATKGLVSLLRDFWEFAWKAVASAIVATPAMIILRWLNRSSLFVAEWLRDRIHYEYYRRDLLFTSFVSLIAIGAAFFAFAHVANYEMILMHHQAAQRGAGWWIVNPEDLTPRHPLLYIASHVSMLVSFTVGIWRCRGRIMHLSAPMMAVINSATFFVLVLDGGASLMNESTNVWHAIIVCLAFVDYVWLVSHANLRYGDRPGFRSAYRLLSKLFATGIAAATALAFVQYVNIGIAMEHEGLGPRAYAIGGAFDLVASILLGFHALRLFRNGGPMGGSGWSPYQPHRPPAEPEPEGQAPPARPLAGPPPLPPVGIPEPPRMPTRRLQVQLTESSDELPGNGGYQASEGGSQ